MKTWLVSFWFSSSNFFTIFEFPRMVSTSVQKRRRTVRNSPHVLNHKAKRTLKLSNEPSTVQAVYTDANNMYILKSHFHHVPCASCTLHWVGFSSTIGFTMKPATWSLVKIERGEAVFSPSTSFKQPQHPIFGLEIDPHRLQRLEWRHCHRPSSWANRLSGLPSVPWMSWKVSWVANLTHPRNGCTIPKGKPMWVEFFRLNSKFLWKKSLDYKLPFGVRFIGVATNCPVRYGSYRNIKVIPNSHFSVEWTTLERTRTDEFLRQL